jgi:hypothetical protein
VGHSMRFVRPLATVFTSLGVVACTAILGDFSIADGVGGTNTDDGGGQDGPGSGEGGTITVTPDQGKMGIIRALELKASEDVTWSVQEPEAGTISDKGILYSGNKPGTYHVIAKSKSDPSRSTTVPVVVVNLAIQVLVGPNGGAGNIDGPRKVAHFNTPQGAIGDYDNAENTGRYFIADTSNHTIRMFTEKPQPNGMVTTIAGKTGESGTADGVGDVARFNRPSFMGYDAPNKKVYVVDNRGTCIRKIDISTNAVTTVAGTCGTQGTFQQIEAMAMATDRHSWLYVCDSYTLKRVNLVTNPGTITNVLSSPENCNMVTTSRNNPDPTGDVWFGYSYGGQVRRFSESYAIPISGDKITTTTTLPSTFGTGSMVFSNQALFFGSESSVIYYLQQAYTDNQTFPTAPFVGVADDRRVIDGTSASVVRLGRPAHLSTYQEYSVIFPDQEAHAIRRLESPGSNANTDTVVGAAYVADRVDGPRTTARLTGPFSITADDAGVIYFGDFSFEGVVTNSTIRKYDRTTATVTTVAGVPTRPSDPATPPVDGPKDQARFWFPIDMTYAKGKLYVVDSFAEAIRSVDSTTGEVKTLAGGLGQTGGYVDDVGGAARFNFFAYPSGSGAAFASFFGGSLATDGTDLFVGDSLNYVIRKVNVATGAVSTIAGSGVQGTLNNAMPKQAQFMDPIGLAYDDGFLYICDYLDNTIRRMNLQTGAVDTLIGLSGVAGDLDGDASTATLNGPYRLVADGIGNLYLTELQLVLNADLNFTGTIRRINIKERKITTFAGTPGKVGLQAGPIPSTVNFPSAIARMPGHDLAFGDFTEATLAIIQPL